MTIADEARSLFAWDAVASLRQDLDAITCAILAGKADQFTPPPKPKSYLDCHPLRSSAANLPEDGTAPRTGLEHLKHAFCRE